MAALRPADEAEPSEMDDGEWYDVERDAAPAAPTFEDEWFTMKVGAAAAEFAMEEDGTTVEEDEMTEAELVERYYAEFKRDRDAAIAAAKAAEAAEAAPASAPVDREAARRQVAEAMMADPRLAMQRGDTPGAEEAAVVSGGAAKRSHTAGKDDLLMEELERQLAGVKIGDRLFCKHRTMKWDHPDTVTVCVTPEYAVVLNQSEGHLEVRWWGAEHPAGGGGIEHKRTRVLDNSHGYLLNRLPLFSYAPGVVGVCDALGRVELWNPETGGSASSLVCTVDPADSDSVCVSHPSAFAVSAEYVVVATSDTSSTSSFYVRRWAANPVIQKYGFIDTVWDKLVCSISIPRFMRVGATTPYE